MSDETPPPGTLIHLFGPPPAVDGAPLVAQNGPFCFPHAPNVDNVSRSVSCRRCKATLDPFDVLLEVARRHEQWTRLIEETSTMRKQLAAMQAEEKLVKARTRSASRKDASEAVAAERAKQERARAELACRVDDIVRAARRIDQIIGRTPINRRRKTKTPCR